MTSYVDIFGNQTVPPSEAAYIRHTIAANGQLVWPYNFGGDDLLTADITEIDATVGSLVVTLPPATEVSVGQDILIRNVGANAFDIVDFASGAVTTVPTGASKYLFVTDNSTEAGVWGLFTYGTGTSGADASLLAGEGLQAISNQLQVYAPYRGVNSSQSLVVGDRASVIEVVTGSLTLTLPQASVATDGYYVFIRNSSAGSTTIEGFGTEQIDGALNKVLAPNESAIFVCNGTYWITVGFGRDATFVFSEVVVNAALTNITLSSADVSGRMIRVAATATGNVTVTLPAVDNIYFVNVETGLGGFNCTFTTGSGATVVLLANQKTVLYCDGTNVSTAITTSVISTLSLNDGSAGAPVLTFALDTDTGFYRSGSGIVSVTSNGTETVRFGANGVEVGAHANLTTFTPAAGIAATNVQTAIEETVSDTSTAIAAAVAALNITIAASIVAAFPVGSVYITATNTNPGTFLAGTTWVQIAAGRALIGVGTLAPNTYAAGDTGGAASVTLTTTELPSHNHGGVTGTQSADHAHTGTTGAESADHTHSGTTAGAGTHSHTSTVTTEGSANDTAHRGSGSAVGAMPTSTVGDHAHNFSTGGRSAAHTHSFTSSGVTANHTHAVSSQGGGGSHENRMPYLAVFFWQRTV